jgi:hypothetical protein
MAWPTTMRLILLTVYANYKHIKEVSAIVIVSHTVPASWLIAHDPDLINTWRYNGMGNSEISRCIDADTENKIKMWCFGHYHRPVDQFLGGIQYHI